MQKKIAAGQEKKTKIKKKFQTKPKQQDTTETKATSKNKETKKNVCQKRKSMLINKDYLPLVVEGLGKRVK